MHSVLDAKRWKVWVCEEGSTLSNAADNLSETRTESLPEFINIAAVSTLDKTTMANDGTSLVELCSRKTERKRVTIR